MPFQNGELCHKFPIMLICQCCIVRGSECDARADRESCREACIFVRQQIQSWLCVADCGTHRDSVRMQDCHPLLHCQGLLCTPSVILQELSKKFLASCIKKHNTATLASLRRSSTDSVMTFLLENCVPRKCCFNGWLNVATN